MRCRLFLRREDSRTSSLPTFSEDCLRYSAREYTCLSAGFLGSTCPVRRWRFFATTFPSRRYVRSVCALMMARSWRRNCRTCEVGSPSSGLLLTASACWYWKPIPFQVSAFNLHGLPWSLVKQSFRMERAGRDLTVPALCVPEICCTFIIQQSS